MSIAKVIEVTARSNESFEAAIRDGIAKAAESVHGIRHAWVKEQQVTVENNAIAEFQVNLMITFVVD